MPDLVKGRTYRLNQNTVDMVRGMVVPGALFRLEGRWRDLTGRSWAASDGNPAAMHYGMRSAVRPDPLPVDDEVWYGHIGSYGHLVHESEIGEMVEEEDE